MKLTMKQLADLAGVSTTTVSLILSGKGERFSKETKERVKKLAAQYHYYPDFYAQNLSTKANKTIGVIVPDLTDFFFGEVLKGIESVTTKEGYTVLLFHSQHSPKMEKKGIELMLSRSVEGIILATPYTLEENYFKHIKATCPILLLDNQGNKREQGKIDIDEKQGMQLAIDELYRCGHRKIFYIKENKKYYQLKEREKCYIDAMKKYHLYHPEWMIETDLSVEGGYKGCEFLLSQDKKIDSIICANDYMAIGVYRSLFKHGYRIPEDISIVGFDNIDMASYITPALTTIHQPIYELGQVAAKSLIEKIQNPQRPIANKTLEPSLVKRESVSEKI